MSLGLPQFGSRRRNESAPAFWRAVSLAGLVVLAYVLAVAANEWRVTHAEEATLEAARAETGGAARAAEDARRALQKNSDVLVAASSVESAPDIVWNDLRVILPTGVTITGLKVDYVVDGSAKVDFNVVAVNPDAYDRFLNALSKAPRFSDIRPGSENRPGSVRALVNVTHRPAGAPR